jgi:poly-beta-1,6-N-acetyl-D-glucosamine N-deacetylase
MKLFSGAKPQVLQPEVPHVRQINRFRKFGTLLFGLMMFMVLVSPLGLKTLPFLQQVIRQVQTDLPKTLTLDRAKTLPTDRPANRSADRPTDRPIASCAESNPSLEFISQTVLPELKAYYAAAPSPQINARARLARVPIVMYHDILPEKQVDFDLTPQEFEADLQNIQQSGLTPVSLEQLVNHLRTGIPLPPKPIVLTFDDGYVGHYTTVYPLLKKYGYPATFAIYTQKIGKKMGRSSLNWEQLKVMAKDPLVTIASHTLTHPDLTQQFGDRLHQEITQSKQILEKELGISINYLVYPEGKFDERVEQITLNAGYKAALTMRNDDGKFAGESKNLMSVERFGASELDEAIAQSYGGLPLPNWNDQLNFKAPIKVERQTIEDVPFIFASGGRPVTIHANSRYRVHEIVADSDVVAAVDGSFFSLEKLDSNVVIGPILSQNTQKFVPGNPSENLKLKNRPLVLIHPNGVKFVPFVPQQHNTLSGFQAELPGVTDGFVGAAWLVKDSLPQPASAFGKLYGFDFERDRAFWGIDHQGRPTVGISTIGVDSVRLGKLLAQAGFKEVIMVDSGASTDLVYQGRSLGVFEPRPVPHVVGLMKPKACR